MYPAQDLKQLAVHKAALRRKVTARREQCVAAAMCLAKPLEWADLALLVWRRLAPLARNGAGPAGLLLQGTRSPHLKLLRTVLRWWPLLAGIARLRTELAPPGAPAPSQVSRDLA